MACTAQAASPPLLKTQGLPGPLSPVPARRTFLCIALAQVPVRPPTHGAKAMEGLRESLGAGKKESRKTALL